MGGNIATEVRFLLKHSSIYGVGTLLAKAVGLIMLPIYTRFLDARDYGILEIVEATNGMLGIVAGIGIATAMSRFYFSFDEDTDRNSVVSTTGYLVVACAAIVVVVSQPFSEGLSILLFDDSAYTRMFVFGFVSLGLGLVFDAAMMYLRIVNRSVFYVGISLINLVISTALNVYFIVFKGAGPIGIIYSTFISRLLLTVPLVIWVAARVGFRFRRSLAIDMMKYSLPLIPSEVAHVVVGYSDRFFINHYVSTAAAGIYGIAMRLGTVLHMLITSPFITTFLPRRFEIAREEEAPRIFVGIFEAYSVVMVILSTALSIYSYELVYLLTDQRFHEAAIYIPTVAAVIVILGFKYHFQFGVYYEKKTVHAMVINLISMVIHIACNAIFIPRFGLWGALWAYAIATALNVVMYLFLAQRYYHIPYRFDRLLRLISLSVIAWFASTHITTGNLLMDAVLKAVLLLALIGSLFLLKLVSVEWLRATLGRVRSDERSDSSA